MSVDPPVVDGVGAALRGVNDYWRSLDADAIERGEHRGFIGGMWDDVGRLQFEVLKEHGLLPEHRLLDVGCGAMRGGVHFVPYLEPGHYCGLDANASLLEAAQHELAQIDCLDRGARLIADSDFNVEKFGEKFHFALSVSVITHLYFNHIQIALSKVARVLLPGGRYFVTFFHAPHAACLEPVPHEPGGVVTFFDHDPFHQSFEELDAMAKNAGLRAELIGDIGHPRDQRLIVFHAPD